MMLIARMLRIFEVLLAQDARLATRAGYSHRLDRPPVHPNHTVLQVIAWGDSEQHKKEG